MSTLKTNRIENLTTTDNGISINNSGQVGIGTESPASLLHLNTDGTALRVSRGDCIGFLYNTGTSSTDTTRLQGNSGPVELYTNAAQPIKVIVNGTEEARFLSGGGLTFNGDTAAANALQDYEEGTWTPTMGFATSYGTRSGQYVKIGKTVHLHFSIQVTGWSTGTGSTRITGLPFNIDEVSGCWAGCINAAATTRDWRIGPWTAGPYGMGVWMENGAGSASSAGIRMSENTFSDYASLTGSLGTSFTMRGGMTYISTT